MGTSVLSTAWHPAMVALRDTCGVVRDSLELSAHLSRVVMVYAAIPVIAIAGVKAMIS